jgi:hypothetical protein
MFFKTSETQSKVFLLIIISALLVTAARIAAPFEVGKDQASQLEAAQRLVEGKGLTTTNDVPQHSLDVTKAQKPKHLTWWPPGFSLLVAAFLYAGLPLLFTLKFIFALMTLVGWIGWGLLAQNFIKQPIHLGQRTFRIDLMLAILLPVFFTPLWSGTDLFLWAGIPFFFLLLLRSDDTQRQFVYVALAGLLFGCLYAIRYASVFLGLTAMLILFQLAYPSIQAFIKRAAVFSLASSVFILPVTLYVRFYAQGAISIVPAEEAQIIERTTPLLTRFDDFLRCLPAAWTAVSGFPLIDMVVYKLNWDWLTYLSAIFCLLVLLGIPTVLWISQKENALLFQKDRTLSLSLIPLSLVTFLSALVFADLGHFLKVRRYYEPIVLCSVFIFYEIVSSRLVKQIFQTIAKGFVASFLLYICVFLPVLAMIPERRDFVATLMLGYTPSQNLNYASTSQPVTFPSVNIYSRKEGSRLKLKELHAANPDAIFYVEEYGYFIYDEFEGGPKPGEELRVFPRESYWQQAFTSRPVKMFWVLEQDTEIDFVPTDKRQVVYSDRYERTKIVALDFPVGKLFSAEQAISSR